MPTAPILKGKEQNTKSLKSPGLHSKFKASLKDTVKGWECSPVVECLPGICKSLVSIPALGIENQLELFCIWNSLCRSG